MHWILNLFLGTVENDIVHVSAAIILSIFIVLLSHFILFFFFIKTIKSDDVAIEQSNVLSKDITGESFEYELKRTWLKSFIYLFISFLICAEIIACWQVGWLKGWFYFIPLWVSFLFSTVMAIMKAFQFKKRELFIREDIKKQL